MEFYLVNIGISVSDAGKMLLLKAGEAYCHTREFIFSEFFPSISIDGKM